MSLVHWKHSTCVVDFNEESRRARSVAGTPANDSAAEPYAIHIIERLAAIMLSSQPPYHPGFFDNTIDESYQRTRQDMMKQSLPQGISLIPTIVYGSRVQNIVDILRKYQADLCVRSLRNKTDWAAAYLYSEGDTMNYRTCPCPVLAINSYTFHGDYYAGSN